MKRITAVLNRIFIDGLSGMAFGLFSTLIIGTILKQFSQIFPENIASYIWTIGQIACCLTGAGIGCGVACKLKASPLVTISAAAAGLVGAFASSINAGTMFTESGIINISGPGEPLGAFVAAYVAIEVGMLVSGKTKLDIILTPVLTIASGSAIGLLVGPPITAFMGFLGQTIAWATEMQPFLMGIVISVLMGIFLTLPISSAAIGISLGLAGIPAGAAVVGCCANMIGFAVASYRENRFGGFVAQGLGTSMLQMPNIVRKPIIWLPAIITSAILGPISTCVFKITCDKIGSGMGTAGLVGPIQTFVSMQPEVGTWVALGVIVLMLFVLPALLSFGISEAMRKLGWIKRGDMTLPS